MKVNYIFNKLLIDFKFNFLMGVFILYYLTGIEIKEQPIDFDHREKIPL